MGRGLQIEPGEAFAAAIARAEQASERGEQHLAARTYAAAAGIAMDAGEHALAAQVYGLGGELFRRLDRPTDAVNCLQLALALREPGEAQEALKVTLAGVLTALGRFGAARDLCLQVQGRPRVAALDSLCTIALGLGDRPAFDQAFTQLSTFDVGASGWAIRLRQAVAFRLDGQLEQSWALLSSLLPLLNDEPAGRGTVFAELAETERLQGRDEAVEGFEQAREAFEEAGRRSLALRAETGRVRTLLDRGIPPLHHQLDDGLAWAGDRGMALLVLDVERVLGRLQQDQVRLRACRDRALEWGLRPRAGMTELWRAESLEGAQKLEPLQEAIELLSSDRPNQLLARVAHAEALAALAPAAGRGAAEALVAEAEQLGMEGARARLDALRR